MAYKKQIVLPTQVTLGYFAISQIDLPVWHRNNSWTSGRITFDRYLSQQAFRSGAQRFDYITFDLSGEAFTHLNFFTQDGLLMELYPLLQNFIPEFADAEIVDVIPDPNVPDGSVV